MPDRGIGALRESRRDSPYFWNWAGHACEIRREQLPVTAPTTHLNQVVASAWVPTITIRSNSDSEAGRPDPDDPKFTLAEVGRACILLSFLNGYPVDWHEHLVYQLTAPPTSPADPHYTLRSARVNLHREGSLLGNRPGSGRLPGASLRGRFETMLDHIRRDEMVWRSAIASYLHGSNAPAHAAFVLLSTALETMKALHLKGNDGEFLVPPDIYTTIRKNLKHCIKANVTSLSPDTGPERRQQMYASLRGLNRPTYENVLKGVATELDIALDGQLDDQGRFIFIPVRDSIIHTGHFPADCDPLTETRRLQALVERFLMRSLGITDLSGRAGLGAFS